MKLLYLLVALVSFNLCSAQKVKTMNNGKADRKNYYTTIPYEDIRGLVIVKVAINGKAYNFMLDTGALTTISHRLYNELKLTSSANLDVLDSGALRDSMQVVTLPSVQVGDVAFLDTPAVVAQESPIFDCLGLDGFIGSNMLRNSAVQFSYKDKTVTITDKPKRLNLNKKNSSKLLPDKMQSNPHLWVDIRNGDITGREVLLFDTGMMGFYDLSIVAYEKVFKPINLYNVQHQAAGSYSMGIHGVAGSAEHYQLVAPQLILANSYFTNVTAKTTNTGTSRIGSPLLKYGLVTVDYKNGRLYFEPYQKGVIDLTEKEWPLEPVLKNDKMVVGIVWDKNLLDKIKPGDEIISFDDINYSKMKFCEILRSTFKSDKDKAVLVFRDSSGAVKEIEIIKS